MKKRKKWTAEEDASLKRLFNAEWSTPAIASLLDRSENSVMYRRITLGLRQRKCWTPQEDACLRRMVIDRKTLSKIAQHLNRSEGSVQRRKERLKATQIMKLSSEDPGHVAQLIKFKMAGWTHARIAKVFSVMTSQVSKVLVRKGFKDFGNLRGKSQIKKTAKRWTELELHWLRKHLLLGWSVERIHREILPDRSLNAITHRSLKMRRYWVPREVYTENERQRRAFKYREKFYIRRPME